MGLGDRKIRAWPVLLLLGAVVAAFDLTKAVHMDDTAHLEIARQILANPLHPMSGLVNWEGTAEPVAKLNQPHLLFYVMAGVMRLFPSRAEFALHVVWCIFSVATVFLFHALARRARLAHPLWLTALFALGPAFLPGQNLMVDVPLVGLWLLFFVFILRDEDRPHGPLAAACASGLACLVKYASLVLIPVGVLVTVLRRRRGWWIHLAAPVAILGAWSLFNWFDYGGVHIWGRPVVADAAQGVLYRFGRLIVRSFLWLLALGAVMPVTIAWVPGLLRSRRGRKGLAACAGCGLVCAVICLLAIHPEPPLHAVLRGLFLANGLLVVGLGVATVRAAVAERSAGRSPWQRTEMIFGVWAVAAMGFIVMLSPFIAVRHVLLAVPALLGLLAMGRTGREISRTAQWGGLAVTACLGASLALSDWYFADVYRGQAQTLHAQFCKPQHRCVAYGHWGWQWYASRAGFEIFDEKRAVLEPGDVVVVPELLGKKPVRDGIAARSVPLATIEVPSGPLTYARTMCAEENLSVQKSGSGGYYYFWTSLPWTLTSRPLERFHVYEVRAASAANAETTR